MQQHRKVRQANGQMIGNDRLQDRKYQFYLKLELWSGKTVQCIWAGSESLLGSCCFSVEGAAFTFQQNLSKLTIGSCCENMDTSWCGSVFTCLELSQ